MTRSLKSFALLLTLVLPCSVFASSAADDIHIINPHARATPPGTVNTAIFLVFKNMGSTAHNLLSAKTAIAKSTELHTHIKADGMMKMVPVEKIKLPAQSEVVLKSGGDHIMLIGLNAALKPGQTLALELTFEDGSQKKLTVPTRKIGASKQMPHGGHKHKM